MIKKFLSLTVAMAFVINTVLPAYAQSLLNLPAPGTMIGITEAYVPPLLTGLQVDPNNPFNFDFILDSGYAKMSQSELKVEADKLIKYFLASLTIPENDLWVNLSPYEKDRIVPEAFGQTEMGRDLLAQDYVLKQLTASLLYPEKDLGKAFWAKVRAKAKTLYGTQDIPVNTFNKVWVIPQKAVVYQHEGTAYILESHLKIMLAEEYEAMKGMKKSDQSLSSQLIREVIVPAIEKEVNEGKNFAPLRQVYHSLILAKWYKQNLRQSVLNQKYSDQAKIDGVAINDKDQKFKIYEQYLESFKKGAFETIKEEEDPVTHEAIPRKYFSGGVTFKVNIDITQDERASSSISPIGQLVQIHGGYRNVDFKQPETSSSGVSDAQGMRTANTANLTAAVQFNVQTLMAHKETDDVTTLTTLSEISRLALLLKYVPASNIEQLKKGLLLIIKESLDDLVLRDASLALEALIKNKVLEPFEFDNELIEHIYFSMSSQAVLEGVRALTRAGFIPKEAAQKYIPYLVEQLSAQGVSVDYQFRAAGILKEFIKKDFVDPQQKDQIRQALAKLIPQIFYIYSQNGYESLLVAEILKMFAEENVIDQSFFANHVKIAGLYDILDSAKANNDLRGVVVEVIGKLHVGKLIPDLLKDSQFSERIIQLATPPIDSYEILKWLNFVEKVVQAGLLPGNHKKVLFDYVYPQLFHENLSVNLAASKVLKFLALSSDEMDAEIKTESSQLRDYFLTVDDITARNSEILITRTEILKNLVEAGIISPVKGLPVIEKLVQALEVAQGRYREAAGFALSNLSQAGFVDKDAIRLNALHSVFADTQSDETRASRDAVRILARMGEVGLLTSDMIPAGVIQAAVALMGHSNSFFRDAGVYNIIDLSQAGLLDYQKSFELQPLTLFTSQAFDQLPRVTKIHVAKAYYLTQNLNLSPGLQSKLEYLFATLTDEDMTQTKMAELVAKAQKNDPDTIDRWKAEWLADQDLTNKMQVFSIGFSEGSRAITNFMPFMANAFDFPTQMISSRPNGLPEFPKQIPEIQLLVTSHLQVNGYDVDLNQPTWHDGRTLAYVDRGARKVIHVKFLKENEDARKLIYENDMMNFIAAQVQPWGLLGQYPKGILRLASISSELIPGIPQSFTSKGKDVRLDQTQGMNRFMVYETDLNERGGSDYSTYLPDEDLSQEEFLRGLRINVHDRFVMARHGLYDPEIIELFHNRKDGDRQYNFMVDLKDRWDDVAGIGRLEDVVGATLYPNVRLSGPADLTELRYIDDLVDQDIASAVRDGRSTQLSVFVQESQQSFSQYMAAGFMGDTLLAMSLLVPIHLLRKNALQYVEDPEKQNELFREALKIIFDESYQAFNGEAAKAGTRPSQFLDLPLIMQQGAYFINREYATHPQDVKSILAKLYPSAYVGALEPGTSWKKGYGWDYMNRDYRIPSRNQTLDGKVQHSRDLGAFNSVNPWQELFKAIVLNATLIGGQFKLPNTDTKLPQGLTSSASSSLVEMTAVESRQLQGQIKIFGPGDFPNQYGISSKMSGADLEGYITTIKSDVRDAYQQNSVYYDRIRNQLSEIYRRMSLLTATQREIVLDVLNKKAPIRIFDQAVAFGIPDVRVDIGGYFLNDKANLLHEMVHFSESRLYDIFNLLVESFPEREVSPLLWALLREMVADHIAFEKTHDDPTEDSQFALSVTKRSYPKYWNELKDMQSRSEARFLTKPVEEMTYPQLIESLQNELARRVLDVIKQVAKDFQGKSLNEEGLKTKLERYFIQFKWKSDEIQRLLQMDAPGLAEYVSSLNVDQFRKLNRQAVGFDAVRLNVRIDLDQVAAEDSRQLSASSALNPGGVDFNPNLFNLDIKGQQQDFILPDAQGHFDHVQINGLTPVIINITPLNNLPLFLSQNNTSAPVAELSKK